VCVSWIPVTFILEIFLSGDTGTILQVLEKLRALKLVTVNEARGTTLITEGSYKEHHQNL
jgi:nitrate reductase beta subunit